MGSGSASVPTGRGGTGPWHRGDRLRLAFLLLLSAGGLVLCWWMVAGGADGSSQLAWIEAGVVALLLCAAAVVFWLTAGHRAVSRRKRLVGARVADVSAVLEGRRRAAAPPAGRVCTAPRMTRYHRGDCALVQGREVVWGSPEELRRGGRRPCGVCEP